MAETAKDIAAQLDAAAAGVAEPESTESPSTVNEGEVQDTSSHDSKGKQQPLHEIPRFQEVIQERKDALDAAQVAQARLADLEAQNTKLVELLEQASTDQNNLKRIQSLGLSKDERVVNALDTIDKALTGELEKMEAKVEAVQEAESKGEFSKEEAQKLINDLREEYDGKLATAQSDMIWQRAQSIAQNWLDGLPQEYTEQDVNSLDEMFLNRVDWEKVNTNPDQMSAVMYEAFEQALRDYGEPRGSLVQKAQSTIGQTEEGETQESLPEPTDSDILDKIRAIDWGKTDGDGKPVMSDEEFTKHAANMMKYAKSTTS